MLIFHACNYRLLNRVILCYCFLKLFTSAFYKMFEIVDFSSYRRLWICVWNVKIKVVSLILRTLPSCNFRIHLLSSFCGFLESLLVTTLKCAHLKPFFLSRCVPKVGSPRVFNKPCFLWLLECEFYIIFRCHKIFLFL